MAIRDGLAVRVRQAVSVVGSGADMDLRCVAHEVVVMDAFGALAGSHIGQDFRQATVRSDVNERGTRSMVFCAADRDGCCVAC